MSNILVTLRELLFPPRCLGCGERVAPSFGSRRASWFCKSCANEWERCMLFQCPKCFRAYCDCTCQPHTMKKAGGASFIKLAPYGDDKELRLVADLINEAKRYPSARSFACCAEALKPALEKELAELSQLHEFSHTVVAHLPRSRRNVRRHGFDQSRLLAKALARVSDLPYVEALKRVHDGVEQKTLRVRERLANVKGAFALKASVKGALVVLVDDVVTTGAGMAEAIRVLRAGGAACVLCVAIAATRKEN